MGLVVGTLKQLTSLHATPLNALIRTEYAVPGSNAPSGVVCVCLHEQAVITRRREKQVAWSGTYKTGGRYRLAPRIWLKREV